MAGPPDERTQFCRECGAEQPLQASYCEECGAALDSQGSDPRQGQQSAQRQQSHQGRQPRQGQQSPGGHPHQGHQQQRGRPPQQGQHSQQPQQADDSTSTVLILIAVVIAGFFALFILAPILAAFVLGLGDTNDVAPNPTFDSEYTESAQTIEVEMTGGDTFTASQVTVSGDAVEDGQTWAEVAGVDPDAEVDFRDSITLTGLPPDFTVELLWTAEDDGRSVVIFQRTGPDAF